MSQSPKLWTNDSKHSKCSKDKEHNFSPPGVSKPNCSTTPTLATWGDLCTWDSPSAIFECVHPSICALSPVAETSICGLAWLWMQTLIPERICWAIDSYSTIRYSKWDHLNMPPAKEYMHSKYTAQRVVVATGSSLWDQTFHHARAWCGRPWNRMVQEWSPN